MMKILEGIAVFIIGLGIMFYGFKYMKISKKNFDEAGVKVDFKSTPATFGFASILTGSIIMLAGFGCFLWGFSFFL